jgi:BirA family transcriptional regulator, biotin operon repressor / biotin---[acetyl-CoA-carboxylase] ligase
MDNGLGLDDTAGLNDTAGLDDMAGKAWLRVLDTCDSTNTWAIAHAGELSHGDVVYTPRQTAGRGQWGRTWQSPAGVITASFVFDQVPIARLSGLSLLVGLAVLEAIELWFEAGHELGLKWPNDVWWGDRKLAGVLLEVAGQKMATTMRVVVGIGLNHTVDWPMTESPVRATSLSMIRAQLVTTLGAMQLPTIGMLLTQIRANLLAINNQLQRSPEIHPDWIAKVNAYDVMRDRVIQFDTGREILAGQGAGIDAQGHYQLRLATGELRRFATGRIVAW